MENFLRRPLGIALGALATASLGGCYYGDVNGYGSAYAGNDCVSRYGDSYYDYDPYAYDDGYGYDCYDGSDYGAGFVNIGFGGGWYDNYYYPGYGLWLFDSYNNRYPLRGQYLNYWGGRRAWWKHHGGRGDGHWNGPGRPGRGDGQWNGGRPGRGDGPRGDGRPGNGNGRPDRDDNPWDLRGDRDRDRDGPRGTRPPRPGAGGPPTGSTTTPIDPGRGDGRPGGWTRPGVGSGNAPGAARPPRSDGNSGMSRPRQQWGNPGGGAVGAAPRPTRPQSAPPAGRAPQAAPPVRSAPPAAAAPPPRPAPATRSSRADRPNHVRED
ncbi:hypothetical protein BWQ93_20125 [Sphingopyxis sp. QXT-31]|uniref:hypothetical protein n=1 Tax=Sphingopyxis sp. QXT-31 TaxID=1357916 RepID=UPI000979289F|nr:hypothetical protein [Sphingopyxis sp. QXT-31]AQA00509.1 hypothetical protein BWQ93_20125 [Sphingopyxis sp. QXT-31]